MNVVNNHYGQISYAFFTHKNVSVDRTTWFYLIWFQHITLDTIEEEENSEILNVIKWLAPRIFVLNQILKRLSVLSYENIHNVLLLLKSLNIPTFIIQVLENC